MGLYAPGPLNYITKLPGNGFYFFLSILVVLDSGDCLRIILIFNSFKEYDPGAALYYGSF
jgi:hypothetical protein